jgi:hypothetical protein
MTSGSEEREPKAGPPAKLPAAQKNRLQQLATSRRQARTIRPDDIGVVRIEFSVPASRLFGPGNLTFGGGPKKDTLNDGDPTDDIYVFDWDPTDVVIQVPWPPGTDPD